jgi:hypothetical protein
MLDTSQWREAPSHCTHSTEAADAAAESRFPRTLADTSAGAADELPPRKVDELSDVTGLVRNELSTTTVGAKSYQSRFCPLRLRTQSFLQLFMPSFSTSVPGMMHWLRESQTSRFHRIPAWYSYKARSWENPGLIVL